MNPSDAGGGHDTFDVWAQIALPALGILVAVAVPLVVLYVQRYFDNRKFRAERASAEKRREEEAAERVQDARKGAIRNAVAELAPFIGMDLYRPDLDVHPYLVDLRIAAMALVDEYPVEHPINDLVGFHQHLGMATARGIQEDASRMTRASVSVEERLIALAPMSRWAAEYTQDLRAILGGNVPEEQMRARSEVVAGTIAALYEKNKWGDPPDPNIR